MTNRAKDSGHGKKGRVTIRDVAQRADVAMATVSRALNNPEKVSEPLRQRIKAAVDELRYFPNRVAGGLASAQTRIISVIIPALSGPVFGDIVRGVDDVLGRAGYHFLVGSTDYSLDKEEKLIREFMEWSPAGFIIVGTDHSGEARSILESASVPIVELMETDTNFIDMCVGFSNYTAGQVMTTHLIERGYKRIAFVGSQMERDLRAMRRMNAYLTEVERHGLPTDLARTFSGWSSYQVGARALAELTSPGSTVDAIFFATDTLAIGALLECGRRSIRVPLDIAVAGFNGQEIVDFIHPKLTTIVSPRYEMGKRAGEMVLQRIQGREPVEKKVDLGFQLKLGEST